MMGFVFKMMRIDENWNANVQGSQQVCALFNVAKGVVQTV